MLFVRNKCVVNEGTKQDHAELLTILNANKNNKLFKNSMIKFYNDNYPKDQIASFNELIDAASNENFYAKVVKDILKYAKQINTTGLQTRNNISTVNTEKQPATKQIKKQSNADKKSTKNTNTKQPTLTKDDKEDIIDATVNTKTDTTSIDDDLINKINTLAPSLKSSQTKLLDPLKVSADVECDSAKKFVQNDFFSYKFLYTINILIIILRGGKIRLTTEELWPTSSINKTELASLLEAIVDYDLNIINENNTSPIYNKFINDPTSGPTLFKKLTGIDFASICKSTQTKGKLEVVVADKVLGPQKLNLLEPGGYNLTEFKKAIIDGINNRTGENSSQLINPELAKSLITIVNKVADETKESDISIEDLLFEENISHKKITYKYNLNDGDINQDEVKSALNRIMNDFGEVLGPLFLLKYLNGSERVLFGSDYSEAMKDYTIIRNGLAMGVSAKSIKGGNAPDIKPALAILSKFITSGAPINSIVDWQKSTITFDQLLSNSYVDNADKIEDAKNFFTMLVNAANDKGKATLTQQQLLALVDYMLSKESYVKVLCNAMGIDSLQYFIINGFKNNSVCDDFFSKPYKDLKAIFDKIASDTGSGDRKGLPSEADLAKMSNKAKLGYFISPLIHAAIAKANKVFGLDKKNSGQVDIISAVMRLAFNYKQIYLGVDCDDSSFTIH